MTTTASAQKLAPAARGGHAGDRQRSEVTEDRLCVTLAHLTYSEIQAAQLRGSAVDAGRGDRGLSIFIAGGNA